jgi:hypothetical protein
MDLFSSGLTASALLSAISDNVQTTLSAIGPLIELAVGIIFAFVIARYLISLFRQAGTTSTGEHHIKSDLNMYHHSNLEMEAAGMDPMGISEYDEGNF